jgi:2-amino-4-hydroxy-6-hydroxymethyldihydropteridine diphosphokinase
VMDRRSAESLFISLGSNLGDSEGILMSAIRRIHERCPVTGLSRLYRSEPQIVTDQPFFLNAALRCRTNWAPPRVLLFLQEIERDHGRDRTRERPKGPRPLDLDMILFGSHIIDVPELSLPHPEYRKRRFVLLPLLDIDDSLTDPRDEVRLSDLEAALRTDPSQGIYLVDSDNYNSFTSDLRI